MIISKVTAKQKRDKKCEGNKFDTLPMDDKNMWEETFNIHVDSKP